MRRLNLKVLFLCLILFSLITVPVYAEPTADYDVIVIGSDPEGISAAVSSARNNSRVLLIDTRNDVGGLYTSGMLSMLDMNYITSGGFQTVNEGFFKEFYNSTAVSANIDIPKAKKYFTQLLQNENVTTILGASNITPLKQDNQVVGLSYQKNGVPFTVQGNVLIDASIDAKFARQAGVSYKVGREELGMQNEYAAATLVFSVQGVDWQKVKSYLNSDNSIYTGANDKVAWGYANMLDYVPTSNQFQLRRLNMSLQDDGSVVINAFQIFNTNSLDESNIRENYFKAIEELPYIVNFLNTNAIGFEKAFLYKCADELYIREGVRIVGEYTLTGEDVFTNVDFKNKIAYGSYPMDLQATRRDELGGTILSSRNIYSIPITIMVPQVIDNLLVVGRSASYDPLSHSSARTVPVGMALGQAAGVLASYSIDNGLSVRQASLDDLHVLNIQTNLMRAGVVLTTPLNTYHPEESSWSYPYIVSLRKKAMLSMEFNGKNDYRCKESATFQTLHNILSLVHANSTLKLPAIDNLENDMNLVTQSQMLVILNKLMNTSYMSVDELYENKIIDYSTFVRTKDKFVLLNEDIYALMSCVIDYITASQTIS